MEKMFLDTNALIKFVEAEKEQHSFNENTLNVLTAIANIVDREKTGPRFFENDLTAWCLAQLNMNAFSIGMQDTTFDSMFLFAERHAELKMAQEIMIELGKMGITDIANFNYSLRELVLYCVKDFVRKLCHALNRSDVNFYSL